MRLIDADELKRRFDNNGIISTMDVKMMPTAKIKRISVTKSELLGQLNKANHALRLAIEDMDELGIDFCDQIATDTTERTVLLNLMDEFDDRIDALCSFYDFKARREVATCD